MADQHNIHCALQSVIKRMLIAGALAGACTVSDIWVTLRPVGASGCWSGPSSAAAAM